VLYDIYIYIYIYVIRRLKVKDIVKIRARTELNWLSIGINGGFLSTR